MGNSIGGRLGHCDSMSAPRHTAVAGCGDIRRTAELHRPEDLDVTHNPAACPAVSPPSPNRPRWPSTPRPRRCRRRARTSSASVPASPTSRRRRTSSRRRVAACRRPARTTSTRPPPACPSCARRSPPRPSATAASTCAAGQVLVTNGGKHAVFTAFAALCDPGDEVLVPAPYWTTYPEAIALAGGVPVVIDTTEATGFQVTVDQLEAAWTPRTKVLLFVSPDNPSGAVYPPEQVEAIGRWAVERGVWVVTDEIYEHLTYGDHRFVSMPAVVPELAEQCIDPQRRRQDVRHDRLAGRLDDRPGRRHQGGDQLPEPRHLERGQRRPAGGARRRQRRPVGGGDDARGVRATGDGDARRCSTTSPASRASSRRARSTASPTSPGCSAATWRGRTCTTHARARRPRAHRGQGGLRPRRGVRRSRLRPVLVRPRRRRRRRGHRPHRQVRRARSPSLASLAALGSLHSGELVERLRRTENRWRRRAGSPVPPHRGATAPGPPDGDVPGIGRRPCPHAAPADPGYTTVVVVGGTVAAVGGGTQSGSTRLKRGGLSQPYTSGSFWPSHT